MILSVIIPTCNRIGNLKRAVNSVLLQNISEFEIVIVDDSAQDQTNLIKKIYSGVLNVKVVRSTRHCASGARNIGVQASMGKYVTFLDDDDTYLPGRLSNMLAFIEENEDTYSLISSGRIFEVNDFSTIHLDTTQKFGIIELEDVLDNNGIDIGFMMKRSFFNSLAGFDESFRSLEDWDLIIRSLILKSGFKLNRLDYAANTELDRPRLTLTQDKSRFKLAEKYKFRFGRKWYYEKKLVGLYNENKFPLLTFFQCVYYSRTLLAIKILFLHFYRLISKVL